MQIHGGLVMRALAFACLLLASPAWAVEGAAYLKVPQGARSSGLGGAAVARDGAAELVWHSPAAISGLRGAEVSLSRMAWLGETRNDFLALALPLGLSRQSLALYGNLVSNEDMGRNALGEDTTKFGNSAMALGVAYAFSFEHVTLGIGVKRFGENFGGSGADAWAPDLGLRFDMWDKRLSLGLAALNLEQPLTYANSQGQVQAPSCYRFGLGLRLPKAGIMALAEGRVLPLSKESGFYGGLEWSRDEGRLAYAVRAGYDSRSALSGGLAGVTLGFGASIANLTFDAAWMPNGILGEPYRMSLAWNFGQSPTKQGDPPPL